MIEEHSRNRVHRKTTGPEGEFFFPPQSDTYILLAMHESGYGDASELELAQTGDVVLRPWARIEGEARIRGSPAGGNEIYAEYIRPNDGTEFVPYIIFKLHTYTDPDGRFVFGRVPPGHVRLVRMDPVGDWIRHPNMTRVQIEPGTTSQVAIGGNGRPVTGRVSFDELEGLDWAVSGASVHRPGVGPSLFPDRILRASTEERDEWRASEEGKAHFREGAVKSDNFTLSPDGSFLIEDLPPGDYRLTIGFSVPNPAASHGEIRNVRTTTSRITHEFTVPEFEGPYSDEPFELPVLHPE